MGIIEELQTSGKLQDTDDLEPPTTLLWSLYYMAQHQDWKGRYPEAIDNINKAIEHSPTLVESYMVKAKIYKHAGSILKASDAMNTARKMDLQDRFVNSKCVKYMLRAGQIEEAEKTISLFTRSESKDPLNDLVEMQCHWFSYESGLACIRSGEPGKALKKFHPVEKTFVEIYDDQFDFHTYSIRKMTLRAYIDLLQMEDRLRSHPFYKKVALKAVELYLSLYDTPKDKLIDEEAFGGVSVVFMPSIHHHFYYYKHTNTTANMSLADRKKALRKAKKAELKKTAQQAPEPIVPGKKSDEDPNGQKYLEGDLLASAMTFLKPLLEFSPMCVQSQLLGVSVYLRKSASFCFLSITGIYYSTQKS